MILPIVSYGNPVLRKMGKEIPKDYENLSELIDNMFETMYAANGVGLAAPQIGKAIRLFIIDAEPFAEEEEYAHLKDFKKVFINAKITNESGDEWDFNEGCLSFPELRIDIDRQENIDIEYYDENFTFHKESYDGIAARIIQHEYDHVDGILFIDHVPALKRRMLNRKLKAIQTGRVRTAYKIRYPR